VQNIGHLLFLNSALAFACCPAMTVLMAIPILGEWPTAIDWTAVILISVGVYFVSGGPLPEWRREYISTD
jgi:drug/metabolite transporter (DMT)-like permease